MPDSIAGRARRFLEKLGRGRAFRRRLPRQFGSRPIWVTPDARLRYLRPGSAGFDLELLGYAERYVQEGSVVWDVGANVGEFTIGAAHRAGSSGSVLAIEPDCLLAGLLQRSLSEDENENLPVRVLCAAAADRVGIGTLQVAARGRAANALSEVTASTQMGGVRMESLVALVSMDSLLEHSPPPSFVKIDVEGAEQLVFAGARRLVEKIRPTIVVEVSSINEAMIRGMLAAADYALFDAATGPGGRELDRCVFNTLAVPRERLKH
jgi:FkbM family methyltransferase